jgi:two-component system sensor histidine kinase MtrB
VTDEDTAASAVLQVEYQLRGPEEDSRAVLMRKADNSSDPSRPTTRAIGGITDSDISQDLRDKVNRSDDNRLKLQKVRLSGPLPPGVSTPDAIVAGSLVHVPVVGNYELYIAFRMDREQEILKVIRNTFFIGGICLVVLVAGIAFVVTRQVVSPVKQAAKTAEELASGRLDRRMQVRGSDELARLGKAFNDMAGSLERQIHRLESLSVLQRRFVSDVSHELRTPLTTIRMAGEVLYDGREDFDPLLARSAELLQTQLDRFEELLADLLEISRFDAGAAVLDLENQDVAELVARVTESLRPLAERSGSVLRLDVPDGGARAGIDARRVERILRNLLANAIDHGEGRPIDVAVVDGEQAVAVGVRDHGVGLREGDDVLVFDRFWRADPARARQTGGTGLGLAIALEDARLHGGSLMAWGRPGEGAHFVLTLPRDGSSVIEEIPLEAGPESAVVAEVAQLDAYDAEEAPESDRAVPSAPSDDRAPSAPSDDRAASDDRAPSAPSDDREASDDASPADARPAATLGAVGPGSTS